MNIPTAKIYTMADIDESIELKADQLRRLADLLDMVGAEVETRYNGHTTHTGKLLSVGIANYNHTISVLIHAGTPSRRVGMQHVALDTADVTVHAVMDLGEITA